MRGYLIWLIVALACSSMAEDPAQDPASDAVNDALRELAKHPATDSAEDPAKDSAEDPAEDTATDSAEDSAEDTAKDASKDPAKKAAQNSPKYSEKKYANDFERTKAKLAEIIKDIKREKRWMQQIELMEQRFHDFTVSTAKEIPKMETNLLNLQIELAKANVMLERKNLVLDHCLNFVKTKEDIRRIAKERVGDKNAELESEIKEEWKNKYWKLIDEI